MTGRGWAYVGAVVGGVVSVAANVAHSLIPPPSAALGWRPEPGAIISATVWPFFLFVAIEVFARTVWPPGPSWRLLRWGGAAPVALVAAVVSYRHMSGLLAHYGEETLIVITGPLAVDGLMAMATGALIATSARRAPDTATTSQASPSDSPFQTTAPVDMSRSDLPPPPEHLRDAARVAATRHRESKGRDITAAELRDMLHVSAATAGELLTTVDHRAEVGR